LDCGIAFSLRETGENVQGLSVNHESVMGVHSDQRMSNFSHRLHADEVSDKVSDTERRINPTPNSKVSKLHAHMSDT
jgi:hypothetical protein